MFEQILKKLSRMTVLYDGKVGRVERSTGFAECGGSRQSHRDELPGLFSHS